jgi:streptogramin lyase
VLLAAALAMLALAGQLTKGGFAPSPTTEPGPALATTTTLGPNPVAAIVRTGSRPARVAYGAGAVWVVADLHFLYRIDPATNRAGRPIRLGDGRSSVLALAADDSAVWVALDGPPRIVRLDPHDGRVLATVPAGRELSAPVTLVPDAGGVWAGCCGLEQSRSLGDGVAAGELLRVDAATGRVSARVAVPEGPLSMAGRGGPVWVTSTGGVVAQVADRAGTFGARFGPFGDGSRLQASALTNDGGLWLADPGQGVVFRLGTTTGQPGPSVPLGAAVAVAADGGAAWVIGGNDRGLSRVTSDGKVVQVPLPYVRDVLDVAVGAGSVWAARGRDVVRIDPSLVG